MGKVSMWKLTISQSRKSEYSEYENEHSIEYVNESLSVLTSLIEDLEFSNTEAKTWYKLERIEKASECEERMDDNYESL